MNFVLPTAAYDNKIYAKFSKNTIEKKKLNKEEFQAEFKLEVKPKKLLICITTDLTNKNGLGILGDLIEGMKALDVQLAVRGVGTAEYQELIVGAADKDADNIVILEDSEENLRKMYAAADVALFFARNQDTEKEMKNALAYAAVPIAPRSFSGMVQDYNPNLESGNSFLYSTTNVWSAFAALVRAYENYRFPYDWKTICRNTME